MQIRIVPFFLVSLILAGCAATSESSLEVTPASKKLQEQIGRTLDRELLAQRVIDYVNAYRARFRIAPVQAERQAMQAAQWMADYQARKSIVTHTADAPRLREFGDRYRYHGGPSDAFGAENAGFFSIHSLDLERKRTYDEMARHIVNLWIASPDHQQNLVARFENSPGVAGVGLTLGMYKGAEGIFTTMDVFFR